MHDVFVVTSEGGDARQAHQGSYPGESIVTAGTRISQLTSITQSIKSSANATTRFRGRSGG